MRRASLKETEPGSLLGQSILDAKGNILLTAGTALTERYVRTLLERGTTAVTVQDEETADIEMPEVISDALRAKATNTVYRVFEAIGGTAAQLKGLSPREIQGKLRGTEFRQSAGHLVPTAAVVSVVDDIMNEVLDTELLTGMAAIKSYDNYTFAHSVEMATAALVLGRKLRLDRGSLKRLARACLLHDIGKIFVDEAILNKQGKLTDEEFEVMKSHPTLGFELLQAAQPNDVLINHVAYQHHERQDGKGYPRGLNGLNQVQRPPFGNEGRIILMAEIAAIADVYDALATDRPYRPALAPEVVLDIMAKMGTTALNQELLDLFRSLVPSFPVGMAIRVTAGRWLGHTGVVARVNKEKLDRPVIRILRGAGGAKIPAFDLDLSEDAATRIVSVL